MREQRDYDYKITVCENALDFVSILVYLIRQRGSDSCFGKDIIIVLIYMTLIYEIVYGLMSSLQLIIRKDGMLNVSIHTFICV